MIKCPYCPYEFDGEKLSAYEIGLKEKTHMESAHADVIEERMLKAGFRRGHDREWVDTLAAAD